MVSIDYQLDQIRVPTIMHYSYVRRSFFVNVFQDKRLMGIVSVRLVILKKNLLLHPIRLYHPFLSLVSKGKSRVGSGGSGW